MEKFEQCAPIISRRGGWLLGPDVMIYSPMSAERCYSLVYSGFRCQIEDDLSQKLHSGVLMTVHVLCGSASGNSLFPRTSSATPSGPATRALGGPTVCRIHLNETEPIQINDIPLRLRALREAGQMLTRGSNTDPGFPH